MDPQLWANPKKFRIKNFCFTPYPDNFFVFKLVFEKIKLTLLIKLKVVLLAFENISTFLQMLKTLKLRKSIFNIHNLCIRPSFIYSQEPTGCYI